MRTFLFESREVTEWRSLRDCDLGHVGEYREAYRTLVPGSERWREHGDLADRPRFAKLAATVHRHNPNGRVKGLQWNGVPKSIETFNEYEAKIAAGDDMAAKE